MKTMSMSSSSSSLLKSQLLYSYSNNDLCVFPIPIRCRSKYVCSSFNQLPPGVLGNGKRNLYYNYNYTSCKTDQKWLIKSHHAHTHKEEDIAVVVVDDDKELEWWRRVAGAASIGLMVVLLMGQDKAAWGMGPLPEGPMVEEFWENVRRYALYALTVSTGVLYAVLQPIVELLKNPISAVLIIVIIGGSFFIFSQILSAMFGVSEFSYQYAY